jgi:hypothetical protein
MTDRPTAATITDPQLAELYADLDRYEEVQGEMNEQAINLTRRAARAEAALARIRGYAQHAIDAGDTGPGVAIGRLLLRLLDEQPAPAAAEATELRTALTEALASLYPLTRVDGSVIGYQTVNLIRPATYNRWQAALNPAVSEPPALDGGPTVTEAASDDRCWPLEKAGE